MRTKLLIGAALAAAALVGCKHNDSGTMSGMASPSTMPSAMDTSGKSLYDRLGGEPAITAVIDKFVAKAASDPAVNFTRKGTDHYWEPSPENVAVLKKHLVQFVSMATGGPSLYEGKPNKEVHAGMGITNAQFDASAADLAAVLDELNVPAKEKGELLTIVGSTRGDIVEK